MVRLSGKRLLIGVVAVSAVFGGRCLMLETMAHTMPTAHVDVAQTKHCLSCPSALAGHIMEAHHELLLASPSFDAFRFLFPLAIALVVSVTSFRSKLHAIAVHATASLGPPQWRSYLTYCYSRGILNPKCA